MAKTIGNDVETFRAACVGDLIDKGVIPRVNVLSDADLAGAADGDPEAQKKLRVTLMRRHLALQDINPKVLAKDYFGHKHGLDVAKETAKLGGLEKINVHVEGELRALPDADLVQIVAMLGLADSRQTALPVGNDSADFHDATRSATGVAKDEHR